MRIKATCHHCGREFLAQQLAGTHGRCPWCGVAFTRDYAANLIRAAQRAEGAGTALRAALEEISDMEPAFDLDEESVLSSLRDALQARRGRTAPA